MMFFVGSVVANVWLSVVGLEVRKLDSVSWAFWSVFFFWGHFFLFFMLWVQFGAWVLFYRWTVRRFVSFFRGFNVCNLDMDFFCICCGSSLVLSLAKIPCVLLFVLQKQFVLLIWIEIVSLNDALKFSTNLQRNRNPNLLRRHMKPPPRTRQQATT